MRVAPILIRAYVVSVGGTLARSACLRLCVSSALDAADARRHSPFHPPVANPETGEAIDLGTLIRHYRGD